MESAETGYRSEVGVEIGDRRKEEVEEEEEGKNVEKEEDMEEQGNKEMRLNE